MPTEKKLTGYPSIDKPWLKYYSEEAINASIPQCTIYQYLWDNNKDHLEDTALVYLGSKISYRELFKNIDAVANAFSSLGIKQGDIVTIALPNIPENVFAVYALNKLGAAANLVDLRSKGETLKHYFSEVKTRVAVICDLFAGNTVDILSETSIEHLIVASPFDLLPAPVRFFAKLKVKKINYSFAATAVYKWKEFVALAPQNPITPVGRADDTACILHTSGTTGMPKGVMLTNENFNAMTVQYRHCGVEFQANDSFMNQVPPFLAYNVIMATHLPLVLHMQVIMLPDYQPEKFAENIIKLKPNHTCAGPADWNNFLANRDVKRHDFSFLKTLGSGSDSMIVEHKIAVNSLLKDCGCKSIIMEGYGMSEAGSAACTNVPQYDILGSVGIPLPKTLFCIYDNESEQELPYNQRGEICISGPTLMKGYYNNPEATSEVLKVHKDGTLWLHSGDLGYMTEDGCVFLDGRLKRIIVRHDGIKVSPFSIEKTVMNNEQVVACCCVGAPDVEHQRGQIPVVFAVLKSSENLNADKLLTQIQNSVESELGENYWPKQYIMVDKLPLTPNGKVDYRALEKEVEKG